jgi:hypothetical protein
MMTLSTYCLCSESQSMKKDLSITTIKNPAGDNGIAVEKAGLASVKQEYPIEIEIFKSDSSIRRLRCGYSSIRKIGNDLVAEANIAVSDSVSVSVNDVWSFSDNVLSLERTVKVSGNDSGGFMSGVTLLTKADASRSEVEYFAPGLVYGSTNNLTPSAIGGRDTFESGSGRMWIREDRMPAPLFGVRFKDSTSIAVLDPAPDGRTTVQDSHDLEAVTLIDERFKFGAIGSEYADGKLICGFWYPGTEGEVTYKGNTYPDGQLHKWRRRYHPLKDGLVQNYRVLFRFGSEPTFPGFYTSAWRWAWNTLKPALNRHDIESVRHCVIKMLSEQVQTVDGRTCVDNYINATPKDPPLRSNKAIFGFTGRNLETALFLLRASYEPNTPDSKKQRQQGCAILDTFAKLLKMDPPVGEGFIISSGEPTLAVPYGFHGTNGPFLRSLGDGMKSATRAYLLEKSHGVEHPNWLAWVTSCGDWLLTRQNPDGSFPRKFVAGTGEVLDAATQTSYNVVPFLVLLSEATGAKKYQEAAIRAAEFCWTSAQKNGLFIGGTIDNPNVIDKEAGTLSLEAYLILYEKTKGAKWLERARMAANFAETWIYLWNVPMPADEDDNTLHWKKGVPTVGVQLISTGHSLVDNYMAFDADEYAKLWVFTKDLNYYDVALILLHNTKSMTALPEHPYDLHGLGWQQEHWSLAPVRGYGLHRGWLPWVPCSQLNGIYGIKDFDRELYERLCAGARP